MTLVQIVAACQAAYGARFQVTEAMVLQFINTIQQIAFNRDLEAFLWYGDYLTIYQKITLSETGYTDCVAADVGRTVTDGSVSGELISYNNDLREWVIDTEDTFSGSLTITSGTGAGTFEDQEVSKGPYSWASVVPSAGSLTPYTANAGVRRMLGVTRLTDAQMMSGRSRAETPDYGFGAFRASERDVFETVRKNDIQKFITFIDEPETDANTYRWVYYIRPPTIASKSTDDPNLLIPEEFHQTVIVEGVGKLCDRTTYGDQAPEQYLGAVIQPFWDMMSQQYAGMGDNSGFTSEGTL